jgi:hypothetical protein
MGSGGILGGILLPDSDAADITLVHAFPGVCFDEEKPSLGFKQEALAHEVYETPFVGGFAHAEWGFVLPPS